MLLLVIFLGLTWCVLKIEEPRANRSRARLLGLAVAAGVLVGVGALTRYAFGWTIIPVVVFLILFSGPKKGVTRWRRWARLRSC
jgi:4-amino-4-deoxy-L-arabinose transferase-like glycosyltransferase